MSSYAVILTDDVPLQLLDEVMMGHILYKNCPYIISPRPKDETANRKALKEETEALRHIPPRPPMDCLVS
jgi:serine carboxypeptidase-like clade 1